MSDNRQVEPLTRAEFAERKHWPDGQAAMQGFVIDHDDVLVNLKRQLDARDARITELEGQADTHAAGVSILADTIKGQTTRITELEAALREIMATRLGGLKDVAKMHTIAQAALDRIENRR